ncbi:MAG: TldD/PmbA family protein [Aquificaceae bacterium]|nr:TldD/PmbA family protein [Aquificaceae bacterium]MDW8237805.1 TldD/PmbA family protein [Aquificaceae bacterium]
MRELISRAKSVLNSSFDFEIYFEKTLEKTYRVSNQKPERTQISQSSGVGVRVFKGNKVGFAYCDELKDFEECVKFAKELCEISEPDEAILVPEGKELGELKGELDSAAFSESPEGRFEILISLEKKALEMDGRVKSLEMCELSESVSEVFCASSRGLEYYHKSSAFEASIAVVAKEGEDSAMAYRAIGARYFGDLELSRMLEEVIEDAVSLLKPTGLNSGVYEVVFSPFSASQLLEAFADIFLGDNVLRGKSALKGMEGHKVFSELLSIIDWGDMPKGYASIPIDAEGVKTRKNVLVQDGVLNGFLHGLYSAKALGKISTGSSVRSSYRVKPSSGISNLFILPRQASKEEMLEGDVVLILELLGTHTVDEVSGDFSLGFSGIIYKGGKKVGPVRGMTLSGNIKDVFKKLKAVGSDLCFYLNVGSPSLRVSGLNIGGE